MTKIKKTIALTLMLVMGVMTTGCGARSTDQTVEEQTIDAESSATVKDDGEANTSIDDAVTSEDNEKESDESDAALGDRVIASSVAVVQILDALGVPMVGVPTSSYELPESVADVARIGSAMEPDMEIIASLEPSIVVSVDSLSEDLKSQFETLGIESDFVSLSTYDGLINSLSSLGERFNVSEKSTTIIQELQAKETEVLKAIEGKESPSVLIIFGAGQSFMVASESSYVGSLVKHVGGMNVIENTMGSFTPVDMEYLADKNPDYILLMAHANPEESLAALKEEFEVNAAWQNFDAVQNDQLFALDTNYFGMTANLYAADAMEVLVDLLYAE